MKLSALQVQKIFKQVDLNGKRIVLIDVMGNKTVPTSEKLSNIYCIDKENNIIWQVSETKTKPPYDNDGFVYLKEGDGGEIMAVRFSGFRYKIDPDTGEAVQTGFSK